MSFTRTWIVRINWFLRIFWDKWRNWRKGRLNSWEKKKKRDLVARRVKKAKADHILLSFLNLQIHLSIGIWWLFGIRPIYVCVQFWIWEAIRIINSGDVAQNIHGDPWTHPRHHQICTQRMWSKPGQCSPKSHHFRSAYSGASSHLHLLKHLRPPWLVPLSAHGTHSIH